MLTISKFIKSKIMKNILVCGAGGFIGGHLIDHLLKQNFNVRAVDIKKKEHWFQIFDKSENFSYDLKNYDSCLKVTENVDYVYNLACNMGGMGFIEQNKADCMLSVLINTNLLRASKKHNVKKYFFSSSACVYNASKQTGTFVPSLKETDAYPADPEDGYGWEKLFSERMCRHFNEDFKLETRVARYHNVYGPLGTYDGGREKAPAALSRKIAEAKINNYKSIDVWGDGEQTRSFMLIDDCIFGTLKVMDSDSRKIVNLGSDEQVSINQMITILEEISNYKIEKNYQLDKPKGVRGRSSDNTLIKKIHNWEPSIKLKVGLEKTYSWIYNQLIKDKNGKNNFTRF